MNRTTLLRKRSGTPPPSPASKRLRARSVEMASVGAPGIPMSTSGLSADSQSVEMTIIGDSAFKGTPMSISGRSAADSQSVEMASTSDNLSLSTEIPMSVSTTGTPMSVVVDPPVPISLPTAAPPFSSTNSMPLAFPAPIFPIAAPIRKPVDELMERAGTPFIAASSPTIAAPSPAKPIIMSSSVPGSATQVIASPTPGSLAQAEPSSVMPPPAPRLPNTLPEVSSALFSADDLDLDHSSGAPTVVPSSPSSSLYTDFTGTPPPDEVSGLIQGLNRYEVFEVVHPETLREWDAVSGTKVIIFIANDTVTNKIHRRVTLIREALVTIFPDADPIIGSAAVSDSADIITRQPVFPFLVHQIPELYARRLILQHCWTVNDFSFFALRFDIPVTPYAMTLVGLHLPARPESNDVVATLVRRWLRSSPSVNLFVRDHHVWCAKLDKRYLIMGKHE